MQRSRFRDEQIIGCPKEQKGRSERGEALSKAWRDRANVLQVALEVRRHGGGRREAA
jgi:hypothetical protein